LREVTSAVLDWITDTVLADVARGAAGPSAASFLLHEYVRGGSDRVRNAVEPLLTRGLDLADRDPDPIVCCEWLGVFAGASSFTDDERLSEAFDRLLPGAIDGLERVIREAYEPGEGLLDQPLPAQVRSAAALLIAYELTGRLPYPMLAEELARIVRRDGWDDAHGIFRADFATNCAAVAVDCRLASLHQDPEYAARAVIAPGSSYVADADRILQWLTQVHREHPASAANLGLALIHRFALAAHPN
jgi:hypothetical protein